MSLGRNSHWMDIRGGTSNGLLHKNKNYKAYPKPKGILYKKMEEVYSRTRIINGFSH